MLEAKANLLRRSTNLKGGYSDEFLEKFEKGELGDDQDFLEWWGLLRNLKKLEENIGKIKTIKAKVKLERCLSKLRQKS